MRLLEFLRDDEKFLSANLSICKAMISIAEFAFVVGLLQFIAVETQNTWINSFASILMLFGGVVVYSYVSMLTRNFVDQFAMRAAWLHILMLCLSAFFAVTLLLIGNRVVSGIVDAMRVGVGS